MKRFTNATAFLEHTSTADVLTYTVPTHAPIDETAPVPVLNQADHALSSQTWFPPAAVAPSGGFVLARVIEDAFTLELRWVSFTRDNAAAAAADSSPFAELDEHPGTLAPVRFTFPARLVPDPSFHLAYSNAAGRDDDDEPVLQICAISQAGYLYALTFPLDSLFYGIGDTHEWSEEFRIEGLEGRTPVLMHGADEGRVVVACADGHSLVVEIAEGSDGAVIETELKTPSSFSIRSLVPSFSRRDVSSSSSSFNASPMRLVSGSSHSNSSPSQLVSLAIATPSPPSAANDEPGYPRSTQSTFGFGVSRDRKLKVWNLETGTCLRSIDLPKSASSSSSSSSSLVRSRPHQQPSPSPLEVVEHQRSTSQLLLPPTPQTFVKITPSVPSSSSSSSSTSSRSGAYVSYLTLYAPASNAGTAATFFVYGLAVDPVSGDLSELAPVAERRVAPEHGNEFAARVVDFQVKRMGLAGDERWNLWTVSEFGGETRLAVCGLSELDDDDDDDDELDALDQDGDEWKVVSRGGGGGGGGSTAGWTAAYFDDRIRAAPSLTVPEIFLEHVSKPARYPPASFDYALDAYQDLTLAELDQRGLAYPPRLVEHEYESNLVRAAAIVACQVELEYSNQTGAALVDEYTKRVKVEWLRFVALLNESRAAALFPTALAVDEARGIAFVVGRDSVSVPVVEEVVQSLHRHFVDSTTNSSTTPPSSLAPLFPNYPESNFVSLVGLLKSVTSELSLGDSRAFESTVLDRLRTPFTTDLEDVALGLFEQTLDRALSQEILGQVVDGLRGFIEPSKTIESFCRLLLSCPSSASSSSIPPGGHVGSTDLGNSVLADLVTASVRARYDLAKAVVLVLVAAWGATDDEGVEPPMATFEHTTSVALSTLHSVAALEWAATQVAYPSLGAVELARTGTTADGELFEQFGALRMANRGRGGGGGAEVLPVPTYSLLNALLRVPAYSPLVTSSTYAALPTSLADAAGAFLSSTGLLAQKPLIDSTPHDVKFAYSLVQLGLDDQVKDFVTGYPKVAGFAYVEARAELALGNGDVATKHFERAASGFYTAGATTTDAAESSGGLSSILPSSISSLSSYYVHLVSLFVPTPFDHSLARFAELALDALDEESIADGGRVDETVAKDLWTKLFRSWAAVGEYEKAYQAIMDTPFHETKTTCLAHFISLVCENGATSLLTTLSFVGLEGDLERNLAFRARNSDPLARPDYYKVLYAYHVSKGDYRSAGTVMYQQARRIGDITARGGSFRDLATVQCQSYLAAANALSLVAKEHAWVAVVADDNLERGNKRRKVTYHIPDDEYDPSASRPLELRDLVDIRREYTVALARLQLSVEFPELERTNFHLEPEAVVALFSQTNAFDQAFNAGTTLNVDLSSLFENLVDKCVGLTVHPEGTDDASWVAVSPEAITWDGPVATKAWRLLERHLARHDRAPVYRYRLVVLERVLATNRTGKIPAFLTDFLVRHQPRALLELLIRFDRLDEAFRYALETIQNSTIPSSCSSTTLPYSVFDQLVAIEPPPNESSSSSSSSSISADVLKQRQDELRQAVRDRTNRVKKVDQALRR